MRELPRSLTESFRLRGRELSVLVIRLGAMGDVVRTLPAVRLIRRALPEASLHWAVDDRWQQVLAGHRDLDGLIRFPRREWDALLGTPRNWPGIPAAIRDLRRRLRRPRPDLVVDFHGNLRSGCIGLLSGAATRLGHAGHQQKEGNRLLTTHRVASGERRTPRMERNLDLVRGLGLPVEPFPEAELPLVDAGRASAGAIVDGLDPGREGFAVICPGASRAQAYKRPPLEVLAAACRRMARRGVVPLVVYGPGEEDDARSLFERVAGQGTLAPPTDLATLCALLSRARIYVGGDSGPLHLACAVGCPVVGIYGPTDPRVNRPWGVPFSCVAPPGRAYSGIKRRDRRCGGFTGLTAAQLESAVDELLDRTSRVAG